MSLSIYSKSSVDSLLSAKLDDAPSDGNEYVRKNAAWAIATGGGGGVAWGSITGTVTSQTDLTSYLSSNYLTLSGGTLTGAISLGNGTTDSYYGADLIGVELTGYPNNSVQQYNGFSVTDGTNTATFALTGITFGDGTTQTTAASGGMDYVGAVRAGICGALTLAIESFDNTDTFTFGASASTAIAGGVPIFYDAPYDQNVIGITQDFTNFYPLGAVGTNTNQLFAQAAGFAGNFNSSVKIYLAFKDQYSTWHTAYNCCVYSP